MSVRGQTITTTTTIVVEECCSCGVMFGITSDYERERRRDHAWFHCPNGHAQQYSALSEAERLKRQLAEAQAATASWREAVAREKTAHAATKGKLTKTLNRIEKGVCPHCNRTFINVQRHMHSKHPECTDQDCKCRRPS